MLQSGETIGGGGKRRVLNLEKCKQSVIRVGFGLALKDILRRILRILLPLQEQVRPFIHGILLEDRFEAF